jgi:anti-anti-sigma regulatory factor/uncharacterized protein (DUF2225 family)
MNFYRTVRGPYACFRPIGEINASMLVHFKSAVSQDLSEGRLDIAVDLKKAQSIDPTGLKFLHNLNLTLKKIKRRLVFFDCSEEFNEVLKADQSDWEIYATLSHFEKSFHEINPSLLNNFFELAQGTGQIRSLELICPVCGNEDIKGFVDSEKDYSVVWSDFSITPVYSYEKDPENEMDPERYRVAVCQECLFASNRLDWFDVRLPEGILESRLNEDEIERILNRGHHRKTLKFDHPSLDHTHFFGMPRETKAAYLAWYLNEMTYRDVAREKSMIDAFQMAFCHFMMCKFTEEADVVESHLGTALAWLNGLINKPEQYASYRILQGNVYLLSVYLGMGKFGEALKIEKEIYSKFSHDSESSFWINRAKILIDEEKTEMENLN